MPSPSLNHMNSSTTLERRSLAIEHDVCESQLLELFEALNLVAQPLLELHLATEHLEIVDAAHLVIAAHILGY